MSGCPDAFIPKTGNYAYLGPAGTNSEEALRMLGINPEHRKPYPSIKDVVDSVDSGKCFSGIIPIENSSEGSVSEALNALSHAGDVQIQAESVLDVHHALIVSDDMNLSDITKVSSHPQALRQCGDWLSRNLPSCELIEESSTARAIRRASAKGNRNMAAIGSVLAAEKYKGKVLFQSIADSRDNQTRFLVIGKGIHKRTTQDKTTIIVVPNEEVGNKPGTLHYITGVFDFRDINLIKAQSLQVKGQLGKYFFYFDCIGHRDDVDIVKTIQVLSVDFEVKVLGSYPGVLFS